MNAPRVWQSYKYGVDKKEFHEQGSLDVWLNIM